MTRTFAGAASCWASKPKLTKRWTGSKRCLQTSAHTTFAPNSENRQRPASWCGKRASDQIVLHCLLFFCEFDAHLHERCFVECARDLEAFCFLIFLQAPARLGAELSSLLT